MTNKDKQKLAIGVVAAVLVIGVLHFLFFSKNASEFKNSLNNYQNLSSQIQTQGSPKTRPDIYQFDFETISRKQDYYKMLLDSGMGGPMEMVKVTNTEEEFKQWVKQSYLIMYKNYPAKWLSRGQDSGVTKLDFLTSGNGGWFLLTELPPSVRNSQKAVSDLLRDLKDTDSLIKETSEDTSLYYQTTEKYRGQLFQFGLDLNYREALRQNLGPLSAVMYTLNRIDLVRQAVGKNEVGITDDEAYDLFLMDLFRFEDYEMVYVNSYRQLRAIDDAIKLADKNGLQNVTYVKAWEETNINWPTLEMKKAEAEKSGAPAAGGGFGMMDPMMMEGMDPTMMDPLMADPAMMFGDEGGRGGRGGIGAGGRGGAVLDPAAAKAKKDENKVAAAIPFEIRVVGPNSGVQSFLYELAQQKRYYAIDKLEFGAIPQEQNQIRAGAVVNVLSYYMKELLSEQQIQEQIDLLEKQKNWLASQGIQTGDFVADPANAAPPEYGSPMFLSGAI